MQHFLTLPPSIGLNSVGKYAFEDVSDAQIDVMSGAGFNVVRLGFSWDLYETGED